jgi:hypothetical protein
MKFFPPMDARSRRKLEGDRLWLSTRMNFHSIRLAAGQVFLVVDSWTHFKALKPQALSPHDEAEKKGAAREFHNFYNFLLTSRAALEHIAGAFCVR